MKTVLTALPLIALALFALGLTLREVGPAHDEPAPDAPPVEVRLQSFESMPPPDASLSITGRVRDASGEPLESAMCLVQIGSEPHWTFTDRDGQFALAGLGDPPWTVGVSHYDHIPQEFTVDRSDVAGGGVELSLAPLKPAPKLPALVRRTLTGKLAAADGGSVEGYEVQLAPDSAPDVFGGTVPRRASVAADGTFEVPELATGKYRVSVLPAWARGGSWPNLIERGSRRLPYHHGATGERPLTLKMHRGVVGGTVTGIDGSIEGALVLVSLEAQGRRRVWPAVQTDEAGHFRVPDLPVGEVVDIEIRAGDEWTRESVDVASAAERPHVFALRRGE